MKLGRVPLLLSPVDKPLQTQERAGPSASAPARARQALYSVQVGWLLCHRSMRPLSQPTQGTDDLFSERRDKYMGVKETCFQNILRVKQSTGRALL